MESFEDLIRRQNLIKYKNIFDLDEKENKISFKFDDSVCN